MRSVLNRHSVRKQIKIRPGFTPQEDMKGFRTKRQTTIESNALPKGHIIGWVPPSSASSSAKATSSTSLTKSAKKNLKRKKKREEARANWEDDDEDEDEAGDNSSALDTGTGKSTVASESAEGDPNGLSKDLERLEVK
jgi:partner of Y14 and mago protein